MHESEILNYGNKRHRHTPISARWWIIGSTAGESRKTLHTVARCKKTPKQPNAKWAI